MVGGGADRREKYSHIVRREGPAQKLLFPAKDRNSNAEGFHQVWIVRNLDPRQFEVARHWDAGFLNVSLGLLAEMTAGRPQKLQHHLRQRPPSAS